MAVSRITWIWLAMMILTLLAYATGRTGFSGVEIMVAILVSAFVKGHWVIADFMELRHAALLWRALAHLWLLLVTALILMAYLLSV